MFCAHARLDQHATLDLAVLKQLLQITALLTKRGWFDAAEVHPNGADRGENALSLVFAQLPKLLAADVECQIVGGRLLFILTDEFSFAHSSAVGLAWEQHLQSRLGFEQSALPRIFSEVIQILGHHEEVRAECSVPTRTNLYSDWIGVWLATLTSILSWEFSHQNVTKHDFFALGPQLVQNEPTLLQPGPAWRAALTDGRLVELLLSIATSMLNTSDADSASRSRQALLALCNLDGTIFESKQTRSAFLNEFLFRVLAWLNNTISASVSATTDDGGDAAAGQVRKCWSLPKVP
eukprot:COSAG05_NODE_3379_length_2100_cov_1.389805_3_plen_293_part_00